MQDVYSNARHRGVFTEFYDAHGHHCRVGPDTLRSVLDALPPSIPHRYLNGSIVLRQGQGGEFAFDQDASGLRWAIARDQQTIATGPAGSRLHLPKDIPIGVYRFVLQDGHGICVESVPLLIVPQRAYGGLPDRVWLLTVQLYSVVSERNWGIGDFGDLARLIEMAGVWGCAGIGLNPLHALVDDGLADCSPYSPNSRLFLNLLYIDVEALPEFDPAWTDRAELERTKAGALVDYAVVAELKLKALRRCFDAFRADASPSRQAAFQEFRAARGQLLRRFASFEVLRHRLKAAWWEWPNQWRQPDDDLIAKHRQSDDRAEIEFVEFMQWCADAQLRRCVDLARSCAMPIGLYIDIAVGVRPGGFDAWNEQHAISRMLSVGAPPDLFNTAGQDWGLAGFNAQGLEARNFEPFRDMLAASMRYAGAVRLDHVIGLNRLYLVPAGASPRDGTYVTMPLQALLGLVALESRAHRCLVIGEDLGTVPDGFRAVLADWGVLSYKVMLFERDRDGSFLPAHDYAADALVTFNTHDLSSFAGWRSQHDLTAKRALGLDPGESDEQRTHAQHALDARLREEAIDSRDYLGVTEFLAKTPSRLLAVAIEDLLGVVDQPNVPGTSHQYPNWRLRLPVSLEQLPQRLNPAGLQHAVRARS